MPAADAALLACTRRLLALRRRHPALRQACWLTGSSDTGAAATVRWLEPDGSPLCGEAWQADHGALAIWLHAAPHDPACAAPGAAPTPVLILINRDPAPCHFTLPAGAWHLQFDSDQPDGHPASTDTLAPAHVDCPGRTLRVLVDDPTCGGVS